MMVFEFGGAPSLIFAIPNQFRQACFDTPTNQPRAAKHNRDETSSRALTTAGKAASVTKKLKPTATASGRSLANVSANSDLPESTRLAASACSDCSAFRR